MVHPTLAFTMALLGGAPGEQPLNALGKPGNRAETHFNLIP